jgi:polysaccharide deacetylase 2 family uncharacterized protein YibQ
MTIEEQNEFLGELLTETIQELMVCRQLLGRLQAGAGMAQFELDSMLDDYRSNEDAIRQLRDAWRVHLEAHLPIGGGFPRTVLLNFVQQWCPKDLRQMD